MAEPVTEPGPVASSDPTGRVAPVPARRMRPGVRVAVGGGVGRRNLRRILLDHSKHTRRRTSLGGRGAGGGAAGGAAAGG